MNRRILLLSGVALAVGSAVVACARGAEARQLEVRRDAGCGCCALWTEQMAANGFQTIMINEADMPALKRRLQVPDDLASCHTATIDGFVIEGHVPAVDIRRLFEERPAGVIGLAVAGMPAGSPGMETPSGARDAFDVIAFGSERRVFASYPASN